MTSFEKAVVEKLNEDVVARWYSHWQLDCLKDLPKTEAQEAKTALEVQVELALHVLLAAALGRIRAFLNYYIRAVASLPRL